MRGALRSERGSLRAISRPPARSGWPYGHGLRWKAEAKALALVPVVRARQEQQDALLTAQGDARLVAVSHEQQGVDHAGQRVVVRATPLLGRDVDVLGPDGRVSL